MFILVFMKMTKSTETVTISYIFKCLGYMLETHYIQSQSKSKIIPI